MYFNTMHILYNYVYCAYILLSIFRVYIASHCTKCSIFQLSNVGISGFLYGDSATEWTI